MFRVPSLYMPPLLITLLALLLAELPERVEFISVTIPTIPLVFWLKRPPPKVTALLAENVELLMLEVLLESLKMPPPKFAILPENVELVTVRAPLLKIPPPKSPTVLPEMVELPMLRVPELLKPPPLPEEIFAPETVTPEMLRLPPVLIVKILKLPWLALILSKEAPRPLMVTVPAVPPPLPLIDVLALTMVGNALARVMV